MPPVPVGQRIRVQRPPVIDVRVPVDGGWVETLNARFRDHHTLLGGAPGEAVSGVETVGSGRRVRYQNGVIYERPDGGMAWVHGVIGQRYDQLGGTASWLGFPVRDEEPFPDDGRVSVFDRGSIYWWPDVGAIDLNDVVVHYTGLYCFGETDWDQGSDEDEPYVWLGVVSPFGGISTRSQIYEDVDGGDSRPDLIELYRGKPYGISLSVLLMENDFDDPDEYREAVEAAVRAASASVTAAAAAVPYVGPILAIGVAAALEQLGPRITGAINDALDTGDDKLGTEVVTLSAKQMVVLAARTPYSDQWGIGWKAETPLMSEDGASYKAYFGLAAV